MAFGAPPAESSGHFPRSENADRPAVLKFIRRVCPDLSEAELQEASENFLDYMKVVWEIYERLRGEGVDIAAMLRQFDGRSGKDGLS